MDTSSTHSVADGESCATLKSEITLINLGSNFLTNYFTIKHLIRLLVAMGTSTFSPFVINFKFPDNDENVKEVSQPFEKEFVFCNEASVSFRH
jgi:hypothetical protein